MKKTLFASLVILGFTTSIIAQIPTNGLKGWYPFNGNARDSSGNEMNGTVYGAKLTMDRSGNLNSAYLFDGMSYISLDNTSSIDFSNGITFSSWIKPSSISNASIVDQMPWCEGSHGFRTSIRSNGDIWSSSGCYGEGVAAIAPSNYLVNKWYHVAGTLGPDNTVRTYINGVLLNSTVAAHLDNNSTAIEIGKGKGTSMNYEVYRGVIDDILIYNRVLNTEEIQSIFYGTFTGLKAPGSRNEINIYPNPATSQTNLKADASLIGSTFRICDQVGRVVKSGILTEEITVIDLDNLSKGIYQVRVDENKTQPYKLVKN
jgi:hypothetical protein